MAEESENSDVGVAFSQDDLDAVTAAELRVESASETSGMDIAVALDQYLDGVTLNISDEDYEIPDTTDTDQPLHTGHGWSAPSLKVGLAVGGGSLGLILVIILLVWVLKK